MRRGVTGKKETRSGVEWRVEGKSKKGREEKRIKGVERREEEKGAEEEERRIFRR